MSVFISGDEAVALQAAPVRIHAAGAVAPPPRAAVPAGLGVTHRFGNSALNSRLNARLPADPWEILWQADLEEALGTAAVLQEGERVLVWGWSGWQTFDLAGKPLANGLVESGDVALDPEDSVLVLVDGLGDLCARRLDNGDRAFSLAGPYNMHYQTVFLARRNRKLVAVAVERPPDPHSAYKPHRSLIQYHDAGKLVKELTCDTVLIHTALNEDTLAIAMANALYLASPELELRGALEGEFEPLAMSLDEAGRIYLIVRDKQGTAFWLLTPRGELLISYRLPAGSRAGLVPPVVGFDHRVYLLADHRVIAIGPDGHELWSQPTTTDVAWPAVTADDQLLVADGSDLARIDEQGERRSICHFHDSLRTPPVLTSEGKLIVASQRRLYCLTSKSIGR